MVIRLAAASLAAFLGFSSAPALAQPPGPEVCANCHADSVESFNASIHGKKGHPKSPASAGGCVVVPRRRHRARQGRRRPRASAASSIPARATSR